MMFVVLAMTKQNLAHTLPNTISKKVFFFEKGTLRAVSLKKLRCHVDFPHISSIALFEKTSREKVQCTTFLLHA